jgi:hypothetical protein
MHSLQKQVKVTRVMNAVAAGTSDQNSSVIDMQGWDGVTFLAAFGTITSGAVTSVKVQQGADSGLSDGADLEGTSVTVADDDDNQIAIVEVYRPRERYVRLVVDRGTQNAVIDGVIAIQYNGRRQPSTHDSSTVIAAESHNSPAEGTA